MTNEMTNTNQTNNNEVTLVHDNPNFSVVQLADGTFKRNMKYQQYFSRVAKTDAEKIELYNVFNDSESNFVTPLKNMVGKEISIAHVFTSPYGTFDEQTGEITHGVTTTLQDTKGEYYATSSKTVYYTIQNIMKTFGYPSDEGYKPVKVKVVGVKRQNGVQITIQLVGLA